MNRAKKLFSQVLSRWRKTVKKQNRFESPKYYETGMRMKEKKKKRKKTFKNAGKRTCLFWAYLKKPSKKCEKYLLKIKNSFSFTGKLSTIKSPALQNI